MDAIVYARWSTKNQEDGDSLARQINKARDIAETRRWRIVEEHIESGKSAYHGRNRAENGKLRALEERAERGELTGMVLMVEAMDRLSRQEPIESLTLLTNLCKRGLTIFEFGSETTYTTAKINENWANLVVALAKAGEAHDSSKLKARRVSSAWRATQEAGRTKAGTADPRLCPAWMEVIDGEYTVIEQRADVIREMFRMARDGHGLRTIALKANEIRSKINWPSAAWNIRSVSQTIHGRRVLGEYQPQRRVDHVARAEAGPPRKIYPEIVPLELWHQAQSSIETRKNTGGPRTKAVNILSHVCRCAHRPIIQRPDGTEHLSAVPCGSRMSLRTHKRQKWQLVCADFGRAGDCKSNATFIYEYLLKGLLDNISHFVSAAPALPQDDRLARIALAKSELQTKHQRLEQLADEFVETADPVLKRAYDRFKAKVQEEEATLRALENAAQSVQARLPSTEALLELETLRHRMDDLDARLRMQVLIDGLVDAIFLDPTDRSATVVLMGGLMAFKLDKKGALIEQAMALNQLAVQSETIDAVNPATGISEPWTHDVAEVAANRDPLRAAAIRRAAELIAQKDH
jgi:DNA invertase Pin-like site-specific DNA recombinase